MVHLFLYSHWFWLFGVYFSCIKSIIELGFTTGRNKNNENGTYEIINSVMKNDDNIKSMNIKNIFRWYQIFLYGMMVSNLTAK